LVLDEEEAVVDRKKHTPAQKKLYKKHHKIKRIIVASIPRTKYMKMSDKSTAKAMFASLCANFEGSKKVKESKAIMLVRQYELFKMKDDESIEEMYSRFQTLVSGLQILKKSYVASNHVSKILRSLPARWRPKVTTIEEAKDLNTLSVEDILSSLKVHEITLNEHEFAKKAKSIALPSKGKSSKALKVIESEEADLDLDLDSESGSDKEEAGNEANVAMGLVATVTSEVEPDSDSIDENKVYSKIPKEELIESLKELLTHFKHRTNEMNDLKEKYVVLMKQQESTLLDLKASEEGLRGFNFICRTSQDKLKFLCQMLQEKCDGKPLSKHEIALEDFIIPDIDRRKVAYMIYSIYKNNGKGIGFSEGKPNGINLKACCECIKEGLKTFVPEGAKSETVALSELEASSFKTKNISKSKNTNPKAMTNSDSKTPKIKILKRSEPVPQSLMNSESDILKP